MLGRRCFRKRDSETWFFHVAIPNRIAIPRGIFKTKYSRIGAMGRRLRHKWNINITNKLLAGESWDL